MTTTTRNPPRAETTERFAALAQTAAPLATGILAPLLDNNAAMLTGAGFAGAAAIIGANYVGRLTDQFPGAPILRAHRSTLFISGLTTGMALGVGTLGGPEATDALLAGILNPASVPGIVSLGWWAAVALVPLKLRQVLSRTRRAKTTPEQAAGPVNAPLATIPQAILQRWGQHISNPDGGKHRHQVLTDVLVYTDHWTGRILAPAGTSVSVTRETVSSVYKRPVDCIDIDPGAHAGEAAITVSLKPRAELDPSTLQGAWAKRVACSGGSMPKTHLEDVQDDPNTGGQAAWVVADEDMRGALKAPDLYDLAGDLRRSPLLVAYEPSTRDVRRGIIRVMDKNPLQDGTPFEGLSTLETTTGWFPIGKIVSGYPAKIPMSDPVLGALHIVIIGGSGAGKGGVAQLVCLGYHANRAAIIYGDPKGASNPAIPKMAAYSGLQHFGSLGALRISHAVMTHRKEEAARLELKNFKPSKARPWVPTVLDEAAKMLGPGAVARKESVKIIDDLTSMGRFIGMPVVLINQTLNLDQIGGVQAIRNNLITNGSLVVLRTDKDQMHLTDLPEGFKGSDPSKIPAVWPSETESLIHDVNLPEGDPRRTFGLGFLATPGGRAGMMRTSLLEDATDHIDPDRISVPEDVPWWGDEARMEEIANTPLPGFDDESGSDEDGGAPAYTPGISLPAKKEPTAKEKILGCLKSEADPLHVDYLDGADGIDEDDIEVAYVDRAAIQAATGIKETTLANTLNALVKEGEIHRAPGKTGSYALGPALRGEAEEAA